MPADKKTEAGVHKKITFQAYCRHGAHYPGRWTGKEREFKGDAAFELAAHNMDHHGGTARGEDTPS